LGLERRLRDVSPRLDKFIEARGATETSQDSLASPPRPAQLPTANAPAALQMTLLTCHPMAPNFDPTKKKQLKPDDKFHVGGPVNATTMRTGSVGKRIETRFKPPHAGRLNSTWYAKHKRNQMVEQILG
jgi:hypothetical protein